MLDTLAFKVLEFEVASWAALVALVVSSLDAHATVGMLLHQHAMWVCSRSAKCSRTIHCNSRPSILRSELEMVPLGFSNETTLSCIVDGNATLQSIGGCIQCQTRPHLHCSWMCHSSLRRLLGLGGGWSRVLDDYLPFVEVPSNP